MQPLRGCDTCLYNHSLALMEHPRVFADPHLYRIAQLPRSASPLPRQNHQGVLFAVSLCIIKLYGKTLYVKKLESYLFVYYF